MELMTTKNGPTLKPGAESLYKRTEKEPAVPPWLPGAGPDDDVFDRPADAVVRFRMPAADGPTPLMSYRAECRLEEGCTKW